MKRTRVIAARPDSMGDVLLTGPAIRALAARADVTLLCGPRGFEAARLLPGVSRLMCAELPWIDPDPQAVRRAEIDRLVERIAAVDAAEAVIFTSFHQSALPLALVMRLAGVPRIAAISEDYPGSLLDVRHRDPGDVHEVERALSLGRAAGYPLPEDDGGELRIRELGLPPREIRFAERYVVVHPGASVPARMWPADLSRRLVEALAGGGWAVAVTGDAAEAELTAQVAGSGGIDLGGRLDLARLAAVIAGAAVVVAPNTGPAHLAAAVGTPVVSLFSPVVSATRWRPWRVPHVLLGDQAAQCAGTRARECPVDGHPCLASVTVDGVVGAVALLAGEPARAEGAVA